MVGGASTRRRLTGAILPVALGLGCSASSAEEEEAGSLGSSPTEQIVLAPTASNPSTTGDDLSPMGPAAPPDSPVDELITSGCSSCGPQEFCSTQDSCIPLGTCLGDGDCSADGYVCEAGACQPGGECGAEIFDLEAVPPNILILLDRSCSMPDCQKYGLVANCYNNSGFDKWEAAVVAINELTEGYRGRVRWGLDLFPNTGGIACVQEQATIAVGDARETEIQQLLTAALDVSHPMFPNNPCVTNILGVLEAAGSDAAFTDAGHEPFVVLITDGEEFNCGDREANHTQAVAVVEDLAGRGIQTVVVGFGDGVVPDKLNDLAVAGARPNPDPGLDYYQASDAQGLLDTLSGVVQGAVGCTVALDGEPPNVDKLFVFIGDQPVERGTADGYDFDPMTNQVVFNGAACEAVRRGDQPVQVGFGCPQNLGPLK